MSDDYSTSLTGVLDTNSLGGVGGGDVLVTNLKSNEPLVF